MPDTPSEQVAPEVDVTQARARVWLTPFFVVGTGKLVVMSLATFGLYQLYWFFRHWRCVRDVQRANVSPAACGLLAPLTCYSLFTRINASATAAGLHVRYGAGWLTTAFILSYLCAWLPEPWLVVTLLSVLPLTSAQSVVNTLPWAVAMPQAEHNAQFTGGNWTGIGVGTCVWALWILGLAAPEMLEAPQPSTSMGHLSASVNETLPATLEGGVVVERTDVVGADLVYRVSLRHLRAAEVDIPAMRARIHTLLLESACEPDTLQNQALARGAAVRYAIHDSQGVPVASTEVRRRDCGAAALIEPPTR